jgi:hypothetical protein
MEKINVAKTTALFIKTDKTIVLASNEKEKWYQIVFAVIFYGKLRETLVHTPEKWLLASSTCPAAAQETPASPY